VIGAGFCVANAIASDGEQQYVIFFKALAAIRPIPRKLIQMLARSELRLESSHQKHNSKCADASGIRCINFLIKGRNLW
jgi:hypothetical protein